MSEFAASPRSAPRQAIVTGAASGAGADYARALARHGIEVAVCDIDKVPLARLANEIGAAAFACDVLSEHSVAQLMRQLFEALPRAELLINAAGTGYVRSLGMMRVSRAFAAAATAAGHSATVANVPAPASLKRQPFEYAGSSHAFRRLSDGLANALAGLGAKVITLADGDGAAEIATTIEQLCGFADEEKLSNAPRQARG